MHIKLEQMTGQRGFGKHKELILRHFFTQKLIEALWPAIVISHCCRHPRTIVAIVVLRNQFALRHGDTRNIITQQAQWFILSAAESSIIRLRIDVDEVGIILCAIDWHIS